MIPWQHMIPCQHPYYYNSMIRSPHELFSEEREAKRRRISSCTSFTRKDQKSKSCVELEELDGNEPSSLNRYHSSNLKSLLFSYSSYTILFELIFYFWAYVYYKMIDSSMPSVCKRIFSTGCKKKEKSLKSVGLSFTWKSKEVAHCRWHSFFSAFLYQIIWLHLGRNIIVIKYILYLCMFNTNCILFMCVSVGALRRILLMDHDLILAVYLGKLKLKNILSFFYPFFHWC